MICKIVLICKNVSTCITSHKDISDRQINFNCIFILQFHYMCFFLILFLFKIKVGLLVIFSFIQLPLRNIFKHTTPRMERKYSPHRAENKLFPKGWCWTWPQTFRRHTTFWGHPFGDQCSMYCFPLFHDAIQDNVAC